MSLVIAKVIQNGDVETMRDLISRRINVNARGPTENSLLDFAMRYREEKIFRMLLEAGADASKKDRNGRPILHRAIMERKTSFAEALLEGYADIEQKDDKGNTPLHQAAASDYSDMVRSLIDMGASTKSKNDQGRTPLQIAAISSHEEVMKTMLCGYTINSEYMVWIEELLIDATKYIQNMKPRNTDVSRDVFKIEVENARSESQNLTKSVKLKENVIARLKTKVLGLEESLLEERLNNESLTESIEKLQQQLSLTEDISNIQSKLNARKVANPRQKPEIRDNPPTHQHPIFSRIIPNK